MTIVRVESEWSEREWCEYLSTSSDPDDQSLCARLRIAEYLKAKGRERRLNQRQEQMLELSQAMNKAELEFLKETPRYRVRNARPCWPRWHWPSELEELYHRTNGHGQER